MILRRPSLAVVLTAACAIAAGARWRRALPRATLLVAPSAVAATAAPSAIADSLAEAESLVVSNDPFRIANAPAAVRYDPALRGGASRASPTPSTAGAPVRPTLTLKAIVGGPPWQAVIDGLPGEPAGTVVRAGAVFGVIRVRTVTRDSVALVGPDTAWTLTFRASP
jgi:hypothetical protein